MSQNLTAVEFFFVAPNGDPVANTTVSIQLSRAGFDADVSGVVMPREIVAVTNAEGIVVVNLQPSETVYYVTVEDSESLAALSYRFYVPVLDNPNDVVRLQDIIVDGEMSGVPYDDAALLLIQEVKANVLTHRTAAELARSQSETAQAAAEAARDTAIRTLPVSQATPPNDPYPNMEWIHTDTGIRYTWLQQESGYIWAEITASLVISSPEVGEGTPGGGGGSGPAFDVTTLEVVPGLAQPIIGRVLIEEGGVAKRLAISTGALPAANLILPGDTLVIKQADGVEREVSLANLKAFLAS